MNRIVNVTGAILALVVPAGPAVAEIHDLFIQCAGECGTPARSVEIRPGDRVRFVRDVSCLGCEAACRVEMEPHRSFPGFETQLVGTAVSDPTPPLSEEGIYPFTADCGGWTGGGGGGIVVRAADRANLNLVITPATYSDCLAIDDADLDACELLVSEPVSGPALAWVVASHEGGFLDRGQISRITFAIEHAGVDVQGWTSCTGHPGVPYLGWPDSGSSFQALWGDGCYEPPGEGAKVGFLSLADGSTGHLGFGPWATWADCNAEVRICEENLGGVVLGSPSTPICGDHCDEIGTPARARSWGAIKGHYR